MGFRFRRSVRIAPGVRLNFGKRGTSLSLGGRGARVTYGPRGTTTTFGLPGTGLSYSSHEPKRKSARAQRPTAVREVALTLRLSDDGTVRIEDQTGSQISAKLIRQMQAQKGDEIRCWLEQQVAELNAEYEACINLHCLTPNPHTPRFVELPPFNKPEPSPPQTVKPNFIQRAFRMKGVQRRNERAQEQHREALASWTDEKTQYEESAAHLAVLLQGASSGDAEASSTLFEQALSQIAWPKDTHVSFEVGGGTLQIDVDLPDEGDMPRKIASIAARGIALKFKERTDTQVRKDFARLAHATLFRVIGEAFSTLPSVNTVVASGYVQRVSQATGKEEDQYVLSSRVPRKKWLALNFDGLGSIDPSEALAKFEIARSMERNGSMRQIQPL